MYPYSGELSSAINGNAYSMDEVDRILEDAKANHLEVMPLVQTFGHLEWILKLEQFAHFREDPLYPQVICFGSQRAWLLLRDMIDQVAIVHSRHGMKHFHIGADEVFQIGVCNESLIEIAKQGNSRERAMLWHIARTAEYVKTKYEVTVLAWHDMFAHMAIQDLEQYRMHLVLEPMIWSYAEDLDQFLAPAVWMALRPFKRVWGASAFKGADGPMRYYSNPIHYVRNHESWIGQMTRNFKQFDYFQGLVLTGWSRYDHLAVLCELFPVGLPALAMSLETIIEGKKLNGKYQLSAEALGCQPPINPGYTHGCRFPGSKIYELVNEWHAQQIQLRRYLDGDYEFNGWLSRTAERFNFSSPMYINKIVPLLDNFLIPMERIERDLRNQMQSIFFNDTINEFIYTYLAEDIALLRARRRTATAVASARFFARRPFF